VPPPAWFCGVIAAFIVSSSGVIMSYNSGLCLDATTGPNGTQLVVNNCDFTDPGQQWQLK